MGNKLHSYAWACADLKSICPVHISNIKGTNQIKGVQIINMTRGCYPLHIENYKYATSKRKLIVQINHRNMEKMYSNTI